MTEIEDLLKRQQQYEELRDKQTEALKSIEEIDDGYCKCFSLDLDKFYGYVDLETRKHIEQDIKSKVMPYIKMLYNRKYKLLKKYADNILKEQDEEFNKKHPDLAVDLEKEYQDRLERDRQRKWEEEHDYH